MLNSYFTPEQPAPTTAQERVVREAAPGGGGGTNPAPTPNPQPTAPACTANDTFPDSHFGDKPITQQYYFRNPGTKPLVIDGAALYGDISADWTADLSHLKGTIQPGKSVPFTITFIPPAK